MTEPVTKSNLPENTAFKQQRLPAWQPVLTAKNVLPTFIIIGLIFIPLGIVLLITSNNCYEQIVPYTECEELNGNGQTCASKIQTEIMKTGEDYQDNPTCTCTLPITIDRQVKAPVYFYYRLTNFYQNHRIYVKSRDNRQLSGNSLKADELTNDCEPYKKVGDKPIAPCGTIANSMFNDTFLMEINSNPVSMDKTSIAWKTDHDIKFNNPTTPINSSLSCSADPTDLDCIFQGQEKPPFWKNPVSQLSDSTESSTDANENAYNNQPLEVWMRTAAFPTFRKLYGVSTQDLSKGNYTLRITYNYPVIGFDGTKSFVIAQMTWAGGKNPFLGIAYIVVGTLSIISAVGLYLVHLHTRDRRQ